MFSWIRFFFVCEKIIMCPLFLKNPVFLTLLLSLMILSKVISFTDDELSTLLEDINKLFQYYIQVDEIDIEMFFLKTYLKKM